MIIKYVKIQLLGVFVIFLAACSPMQDKESHYIEGQVAKDTLVTINQTIDLTGVTPINATSQRARVQYLNQLTSEASIEFATEDDPINGNLSFRIAASDTLPMSRIELSIGEEFATFTICETECGNEFNASVIGLNPMLAGLEPGNINLQVWISNSETELTLVNSTSINWQPFEISGLTANRTEQDVSISWQAASNIFRYNVYVSSEGINQINRDSLEDAQQFLALRDTSLTIPTSDPNLPLHVLVTGVEGSGESGFSEVLVIAGLDGSLPNDPAAIDDFFTIQEDNPLSANILDNDLDPNNGTLRAFLDSDNLPSNGDIELNENGDLTYIPNPNFFGQDSFRYTVINDLNLVSSATVFIEIQPVNDVPDVLDDEYMLPESGPLVVDAPGVLRNDADIDGDILTVDVAQTGSVSDGTLQISEDGSFSFTPLPTFNGSASFSYVAVDGQGGESTGVVTITGNALNQPPQAVNDFYEVDEDVALVVSDAAEGLLANDSDPNSDSLEIVENSVSAPSNGTLVVASDGTFQYFPDADFFGVDSFTYQISDTGGLTAMASVQITVNPLPDLPVTVADQYTLSANNLLNVSASEGVLANDIDPDGGQLTVDLNSVSQPSVGTLEIFEDGRFNYSISNAFDGTVTFTYKAQNLAGLSETTTVELFVSVANQSPIVNDESFIINEDSNLFIGPDDVNNLLINDSDPDGDNLSIIVYDETHAVNGQVTLNADGSFEYVPNPNFSGVDNFTYDVEDGNGGVSTGTVTITVEPINDNPIAAQDSFSIFEDMTLVVSASSQNNLLSNDSDIEQDLLTVNTTPISEPANGTLILFADGGFEYSPNSNYFGLDSFEYEISDGNGGVASAIVNIAVDAINDQPIAVNDSFEINEDTVLNASSPSFSNLLANDIEVDGDALTVSATPVQSPANGSLSLNMDGTFEYTPNVNFFGVDSFSYRISDPSGLASTGAVQITVNNVPDAPVTNSDQYNLTNSNRLTTDANEGVLANDTDLDNGVLTVDLTSVTQPSIGTVEMFEDGRFIYNISSAHDGVVSFSYRAKNADLTSDLTNVDITVSVANQSPNVSGESFNVDEDIRLIVGPEDANNLLANDSDPDGDSISIMVDDETFAANGTVTLNSDGSFEYLPDENFNGVDSFNYDVVDGNGGISTATVTITVNAINDDPIATSDAFTISEDSPLMIRASDEINLISNDIEVDQDTLIVNTTPVSGPSNGELTLYSDGGFDYLPFAEYFGSDSFVYEVSDGNGGLSSAMVTITVASVNDVPVAVNDSFVIDEDSTLNASSSAFVNLLANDTDVEGDTLTMSTVPVQLPTNGTLTLNADGSFEYTPTPDFNGADSFSYTVNDGNGGSATGTVSLTINPINDLPVAGNNSFVIDEDSVLNSSASAFVNLLDNDTDTDGDTLTVETTPAQSPSSGTLNLISDGTFEYVPNANFNGADSFSYTVNDGNGGSTTASVTITITPINDVPVSTNDSFAIDEDSVLNSSSPAFENLLDNDTDVDGDSLTIETTPVQAPTNGTLTLSVDGSFEYTPSPNFNGVDSFSYTVSDGNGGTAVGTVTLTINEINDNPVAEDDVFSIDEDVVLSVLVGDNDNLLNNDNDVDIQTNADSLSVTLTPLVEPSNGSLNLNADGSFTYTPDLNYNGSDSFTYEVTDEGGLTSNAAVSITINALNDAPDASDETFSIAEDAALNAVVGTLSASDVEGDNLTFTITGGADANLFNINSTSGEITVAVSSAFNFETVKQHEFSVRVTDDGTPSPESTDITVTVDVIDIPEPVAPVLDQNFGSESFGEVDYETYDTRAKYNDVVEYNGTFYYAGYLKTFDKDILITAYKDNGELDTSFSFDGKFTDDLGGNESVEAIIESNGSLFAIIHKDLYTSSEVCILKLSTAGIKDQQSGENNSGIRCTDDGLFHKPMAVEKHNSTLYVVGASTQSGNTDSLFIKFAEADLTILDNTPIITDVSGITEDDYATDIKWFDGNDFMTVGSSVNVNGDTDGYVRYVDDLGVNKSTFNSGQAVMQDWSGVNKNDKFYSVDGAPGTGFIAYVGGYYTASNNFADSMVIAIDATGALDPTFGTSGRQDYDFDLDAGLGLKSSEIRAVKYDSNTSSLFFSGGIKDGLIADQSEAFVAKSPISQSGGLDLTFGVNGLLHINNNLSDAIAESIALSSNGAVWMAGYIEETFNVAQNAVAISVTPIGQLSTCFPNANSNCSTDGFDEFTLPEQYYSDDIVATVRLQNGPYSGSFLSVGMAVEDGISEALILTRVKADGTLDKNIDPDCRHELDICFQGGGLRVLDLDGTVDLKGVLELSDGSLLIYGDVNFVDNWTSFIFKLDSELNPVSTFANNGTFFTDVAPSTNIMHSLIVDSNDKILVVGHTSINGTKAKVYRLNSDGSYDASFGSAGAVILDDNYKARSIQEDSAGNYVIATVNENSGLILKVIRLNSSGALDTSYAGGGYINNFGSDMYFEDVQLLVDNNDKSTTIFSYYDYYANTYSSLFIRLLDDGSLDTSFDTDGLSDLIMSAENQSVVHTATFDSQGNIIVAGWGVESTKKRGMIGRIKSDGQLDTLFNSVGYINQSACGDSDFYNSLVLVNDNEVVVSGSCLVDDMSYEYDASIFRYQFNEMQQ